MITFTRDWRGYAKGSSIGTLAATLEAVAVAEGAATYGGIAGPLNSSLDRYGAVQALVDGAGNPVSVGGDGSGDALVANPLSQFAATTSLQLKGVISDETGSGSLVFATSPTLVTPVLGVASATSLNKVAITAPATGATLVVPDGVTATMPSTSGTVAKAVQTEAGFSFAIDAPADQDYTIILRAPHAGTITETSSKCTSGTCTATFKIGGVALGGAANAVSSTQVNTARSTFNAFAAGDAISVTISANSTCVGAAFSVKYTRTLA